MGENVLPLVHAAAAGIGATANMLMIMAGITKDVERKHPIALACLLA